MPEENVTYWYRGKQYPSYLKNNNAMSFIVKTAEHFCRGEGLDIGAGEHPFPGARPVDISVNEYHAYKLPDGGYDYIFSSHCLEHLENPVKAIEIWKSYLKENGTLFLYLPHPDMEYWLPSHNRRHLHSWKPEEMKYILECVGFYDVIMSGRDSYWSYFITGLNRVYIKE